MVRNGLEERSALVERLLDPDASVRWQVLRDLLHAEVETERERTLLGLHRPGLLRGNAQPRVGTMWFEVTPS
jgi:hypothetical protein